MLHTFILWLGLWIWVTPFKCNSAVPALGGPTCELGSLVSSGNLRDLRWPDFSEYRTRVQSFYEHNAYNLAWTKNGAITDQAKSIINLLKTADAKGMEPQDYDGPRWDDRLALLGRVGESKSASTLARFDLALTVSIMRYISDIHFGRVNPGLFHRASDSEQNELTGSIVRDLVSTTNVREVLDGVEPAYAGYRRTQQVLQQYVAMAREARPGVLPVTKGPVEPNSSYIALAQLADLLKRLGDLPAETAPAADSGRYEGPLVAAVQRFQTRHGLQADGRIGKATFTALNTPLSYRARQLRLALERWRWLPHHLAGHSIVVNIPEFTLRALNESPSAEIEMKVVVGRAYRHQTPVFAADLKYVVFRPYWNVPLSIQRAELIPAVVRDPAYLVKNGYEIVTPQGTVVSRGSVEDAILTQLRSGKLQIRQTPGPKNSLGLVKFLFPNEHNVYLHGTPATELFSRSRRDFSHGCLRVEKPAELAAWVLRDQAGWTAERIQDAMQGEDTIQVTLEKPIPVFIVYATALVLPTGEARFFDDIYREDARLEQLLANRYPDHQRGLPD